MECQELMALDFKAHYFSAFAHLPSYTEWLLDADLTSTYRYERRVLKLLQWGEPTRRPWRLKCPSHLLWLDHLAEVFPEARFVMTHRDPTDVMVSVADLYCEVGRQFSDERRPALPRAPQRRAVDDRHGPGPRVPRRRTATTASTTSTSGPCSATRSARSRRLYAWLGEPVSDAFAAGMERWWHDNNAERDENVHPDPAEFGLDLDEVRARFAEYTTRAQQWTERKP